MIFKKQIRASLVALTLVATLAGPFGASAQTGTSSLQAQLDLIASLTAQIQALQNQLNQLQGQRQSAAVALIKSLGIGSSGDDVKTLQAILAADPQVYPQGLITGFFGNLTSEAVKRFQEKHGIEKAGVVGPKTLKKLNEFLDEHPLSFEDSTSTSAKGEGKDNENDNEKEHGRLCAIVPPGHLIAPGWLRKHEDDNEEDEVVPACQTLPPGIVNQIGTTTPAVALSISGVSTSNLNSSSAHLIWSTNLAATSKVWYSTSSPVNAGITPNVSDGTLLTSHDVALSGLASATTYYYVIGSATADGTSTTAGQFSFVTAGQADVNPPIISGAGATSVSSSSAHIVWTTNEGADSRVWYGTTTPVSSAGTPGAQSSAIVVNHDVTLSGLMPGTTYYYVIGSADASGNLATYTQSSLATTVVADTTAPVISGLTATPTSNSATITWTTNEPATGKVWYGTSTPVDVVTASSYGNGVLATSHSLGIPGLTASSTYYYVVQSADAAGNIASSTSQMLLTL